MGTRTVDQGPQRLGPARPARRIHPPAPLGAAAAAAVTVAMRLTISAVTLQRLARVRLPTRRGGEAEAPKETEDVRSAAQCLRVCLHNLIPVAPDVLLRRLARVMS
jgi:hypothetical protein